MWFCIVFFSLCALVGLAAAVKPGSLTLSPEGFRQERLGRSTIFQWSDVGLFWPGVSDVHFEWNGSSLTGRLGEIYGMPAKELADLMNVMRTLYAED